MSSPTREADFQRQVENLAGFYGWSLRFHAPDNIPRRTRSGRVVKQNITPGWPDLVLCRPPEILFVELKGEKTRVSPEQREWIAALTECGLETYLWRPSDWDELHARLSRGRQPVEPLYRVAA